LAVTYGDQLALIRYHGWWPSNSDPYYQYNISQNTARINYYGADYSPHLWIDGTVNGQDQRNNWDDQISAELGVDSPLDIQIRGNYDPVSRVSNIIVTVIATGQVGYSNLKLRIALVESRIAWQAPNESYWHNQTFRNMYPNTSGVSLSLIEGQSFDYAQTFTVNSALDSRNCEIVAFVQSDNGRRILQGAKIGIPELSPANALLPFSLIFPDDGATIDTCYPHFEWHSTTEPGSGTAVYYSVYVAQEPTFSNPTLISNPSPDTIWTSGVCLIPDILYYWKVLASNGSAPDRYSEETFTFTIQQPQQVPTISEWGMILMGLLILALGTIAVVGGRRSIPVKIDL